MGKGRDKRRKQKGSASAGQGAVKTQRKTAKNAEKTERRVTRRLELDEEDIDALIEKFQLEDKRQTETQVEDDCQPPSVRVHATYTPLPNEFHKDGLVMVFGGEYEDPQDHRVYTYNDLFRFNTEKQKWSKISAPNGPSPRSSHQTVYYKNALYVFGGEFTSPKQDRFKHFRELWRFDLKDQKWEKYEMRRGPSGRSGHRAVVYKDRMIVFGGFNDSGDDAVYYNDAWVFHFSEMRWETAGSPTAQRPSKRGGFRMMVHEHFAYVYGGYSRIRDEDDKDIEHGKTVDDMWRLDLQSYEWGKVKRAGILPGVRSGFNMCVHQHRAVLFGGATDNEARKGESIVSDFHNDLFQFNFDRQKWYTVNLKPPKCSKMDVLPDVSAAAVLAEEEEKMRQHQAAVKIQSRQQLQPLLDVRPQIGCVGTGELLYSPATYGFDLSVLDAPKPRGRISAGLCVVKNALWLFGGVVEILDREVTLDDIWKLSLKNYDGWHCIKQNSVGEDAFKEEVHEERSTSEEEEDGSESDMEVEESE